MSAEKNIKVEDDVDDEITRLVVDYRVSKGHLVDAFLRYTMRTIERADEALEEARQFGSERAKKRRSATVPLRPTQETPGVLKSPDGAAEDG